MRESRIGFVSASPVVASRVSRLLTHRVVLRIGTRGTFAIHSGLITVVARRLRSPNDGLGNSGTDSLSVYLALFARRLESRIGSP